MDRSTHHTVGFRQAATNGGPAPNATDRTQCFVPFVQHVIVLCVPPMRSSASHRGSKVAARKAHRLQARACSSNFLSTWRMPAADSMMTSNEISGFGLAFQSQ